MCRFYYASKLIFKYNLIKLTKLSGTFDNQTWNSYFGKSKINNDNWVIREFHLNLNNR